MLFSNSNFTCLLYLFPSLHNTSSTAKIWVYILIRSVEVSLTDSKVTDLKITHASISSVVNSMSKGVLLTFHNIARLLKLLVYLGLEHLLRIFVDIALGLGWVGMVWLIVSVHIEITNNLHMWHSKLRLIHILRQLSTKSATHILGCCKVLRLLFLTQVKDASFVN